MDRLSILQKAYEMAQHNLCCYSADHLCTRPRPTSKREWEQAREETEILAEWIAELGGQINFMEESA